MPSHARVAPATFFSACERRYRENHRPETASGPAAEGVLGDLRNRDHVVLRRDGPPEQKARLGAPYAGLLRERRHDDEGKDAAGAHKPRAQGLEILRQQRRPRLCGQIGQHRIVGTVLGLAEQARLRSQRRRIPLHNFNLREMSLPARLEPRSAEPVQLHGEAVPRRVPRGKGHGPKIAVAHDDLHLGTGSGQTDADNPRPAARVQEAPRTDNAGLVGDLFQEKARPRVDIEGRK